MKKSFFYIEQGEVFEILISVLAISAAFALVFYGLDGLVSSPREFFVFAVLCIVGVGTGFIFHEMGHKVLAIYYGAYARFKMWVNGLAFMLFTSIFGILIASPGAVYIYSDKITRKENGLISLVGPLINVAIMFIFMALALFAPLHYYFSALDGVRFFGFGAGGRVNIWAFGAGINLLLAMFNMIPAFPLDGSKVFMWDRRVWIGVMACLLGIAWFVFSPSLVITWSILLVIAIVFSKLAFGGRTQ